MNHALDGSILKLDIQGAFFLTFLSKIAAVPKQSYKAWVRNCILAIYSACSTNVLIDSNSSKVFLQYAKIEQVKERITSIVSKALQLCDLY